MSDIKQAYLNKARQDKFIMSIPLPPALLKVNKKMPNQSSEISLDSLQFSVYGAVVPKISIPTKAVVFGGHESAVQVSSHFRPTPEPLAVKFNVDTNFWNYWSIWSWLNLLNDANESGFNSDALAERTHSKNPVDKSYGDLPLSSGIHKQYTANISLFGMDEYNNQKIEFKYIGAFPTQLDGIEYNYQAESEVTCGVTFGYTKIVSQML